MNAAASKGEHIRSEDRPPSWTPKRRDIAPGVDHGGGAIAEIVRDTQGALVTTVYPHADALGSPNLFVNEDGDLTRQGFAPFGQPVAAMPPGDTDSLIGFTGHDHDAELGLINMQGRIYDPTLGRFLTADPIVQSPFWSQGLNRYAYVFNSPMNLVDPSGFSAIGDYFQSLNDAPPEHAVPGYIGTGLVAGLAAAAIYEGVSASIAAGTASTVSTAATQSGGGASAGPYTRGAGAATVAVQRIGAAMDDSITRKPGVVPTQAAARSVGATKAHAISQPRKVGILDSDSYVRTCGGDVCLEILRQKEAARLKTIQENTAAIREGEWQLFWAYTGAQAVKFARWSWGTYKAWRAAEAAEAAAKVARAAPKIPFNGFQEWGRPLWGTNVEGAQKALEKMTPEVAKAIDAGKARQALDFYKQAAASGRGGETAAARVRLMERILQLQK